MLVAQVATGDGLYALALAVVVAFVYIAVIRALDLNEKEPLWAIGLVFGLGVLAGAALHLTVSSTVLELSLWGGTIAKEIAKVVAIACSIAVLSAVSRLRGWSEVNGVLDGIVYGATAGLGFAVGALFVRELLVTDVAGLAASGTGIVPIALIGLSEGLFGAIIGAGFGAAVEARDRIGAIAMPVLGFVGAVLVHVGYEFLRTGHTLSGAGLALKWVTLLLPVAFLAAVVVHAIVREQQAIAAELADEAGAGVVTEEELVLLKSFVARRGAYARRLFSGDLDGWSDLRELHNRQVQLALAERRYRRTTDPDRRADLLNEVQRLRSAILALKSDVSVRVSPDGTVSLEA